MAGEIAAQMTSAQRFVLGIGGIVSWWQEVRLDRQVGQGVLPIEHTLSSRRHPEDTAGEVMLVAIGQLHRQLRLADATHTGYAHQPQTHRMLLHTRSEEQAFQPLKLAGARLKEGIARKRQITDGTARLDARW